MTLPLLAAAMAAVLGLAPGQSAAPKEATRTIRVELRPKGTHVDRQGGTLTVEVGYDEGPPFPGYPSSPWVAAERAVQRLEIAPDESTWIELEVPVRVLAQPDPCIWARFDEPTFTRGRCTASVSETDADVFRLWLTGRAGFSLEGQIHYPDGAPAEDGVEIQVASDLEADWPDYPRPLGKLGPDGQFHLACNARDAARISGTCVVRAEHPVLGFGPSVEVRLRAEGGALDVQLELPPRGVLGGVLETADGTPVPGARLRAVPMDQLAEEGRADRWATVETDSAGRFHFSALLPGERHHVFLLRPRHAALPECLTEEPVLPLAPGEDLATLTLITRTPHLVVSARSADGRPQRLVSTAVGRRHPEALELGQTSIRWTSSPSLRPALGAFNYDTGPWWLPRPRSGQGAGWPKLDDGRVVLPLTPGEVLRFDLLSDEGATAKLVVEAPTSGLVEREVTLAAPLLLATLRIAEDLLPGDSELVVYTATGTPIARTLGVISGMCGLSYMIERPEHVDLRLPPGRYRLVLGPLRTFSRRSFAPRVVELELEAGQLHELEHLPKPPGMRLQVRFEKGPPSPPAHFEGQERWAELLGKHRLKRFLGPLGRSSDSSYVGARLLFDGADPSGLHDLEVLISLEPCELSLPLDDYRVVLELPGREPLEIEVKASGGRQLRFEL